MLVIELFLFGLGFGAAIAAIFRGPWHWTGWAFLAVATAACVAMILLLVI